MSKLRVKYKKLKHEHDLLLNKPQPIIIREPLEIETIGTTQRIDARLTGMEEYTDKAAARELGLYALDTGLITKERNGDMIRYSMKVLRRNYD